MINKKLNLDWLELVFDYTPNFIKDLNKEPLLIKTLNQKLKRGYKTTYFIDDLYEVYILEPAGIVQGRIYVKILNPNLYNDKLLYSIQKIKDLTLKYNWQLLTINKLDLAIDLIDIDLFEQIDLNKLDLYQTKKLENKPVYLEIQANEQGGKTLYYNIVDIKAQAVKKRYKKQRVSATLYTKTEELKIKNNRYKQSYQNPNDKTITRLEIKLQKDNIVSKENFLLKAIADFIWTDPERFIRQKESILQYIYMVYQNLYYLSLNGTEIIEYKTLFNIQNEEDEYYDFIHIEDFISIFKQSRLDYNIKTNKYRKERPKPLLNKKLYLSKLEAIIMLNDITPYHNILTNDFINKLIEQTGIENHNDLDKIKIKNDILINNRNLHLDIHNFIYDKVKSLSNLSNEINDEDIFKDL